MGEAFGVLIILAIFAFGVYIYFIPAIVANKKKHESFTGILLLNIFLGWSLIGWVIALVWAVSEKKTVVVYAPPQSAPSEVQMKKCGFCAEEVLAEAIKCKHCGSDLSVKEPVA